MIEITEDAPPRRSFVQAEVRAFRTTTSTTR